MKIRYQDTIMCITLIDMRLLLNRRNRRVKLIGFCFQHFTFSFSFSIKNYEVDFYNMVTQ